MHAMSFYSEPGGREGQVIVLRPFLKPPRRIVENLRLAVFGSQIKLPELALHTSPVPPDDKLMARYPGFYPELPERGQLWHLMASADEQNPTQPHPFLQIGNLIVAAATQAEVREVCDEWVNEGIYQRIYTGDDMALTVHEVVEQNGLPGQNPDDFLRTYVIGPRPEA